jgi:DNA processing protein
VLARWTPAEAWQRACDGRLRPGAPGAAGAELAVRWRRHAQTTDVATVWAALRSARVTVSVAGQAGYPEALGEDPERPAVLFSLGDAAAALDGRRVAIVGTRACTRYGRDVAYDLGRDLAANGVRIVSGLALGVDGAAHSGALAAGPAAAPPVAVVGSGLDVVYPRRHARLWHDVAAAGAVLSEAPLGAAPEPWRFPVRNRIIAALAEVVVVVESAHTGGSRHTVEAAMQRDRPVLAVPGPVRSTTSDLPNLLLAEGCHPARDALDVLVALDLAPAAPVRHDRPHEDPRPPPDAVGAAVLEALGWQPATFEHVVVASGRGPAEVGMALVHLERDGWVAGRGGWWERLGASRSAG